MSSCTLTGLNRGFDLTETMKHAHLSRRNTFKKNTHAYYSQSDAGDVDLLEVDFVGNQKDLSVKTVEGRFRLRGCNITGSVDIIIL